MTKIIRWGIIGCGNVTEVKSGPALQNANNSALVAVMRRDTALAEDYARRHGVAKWYSEAEALINDPEVDAVYIATPPSSHKEYTLTVARAGKPVYVEKPMARNHAECQAMIAACQAAAVPLFVAYYRRRLPRFVQIKELIDTGAIGQPLTVTITYYRKFRPFSSETMPWRFDPAIAGGGLFVDLASHTLDFLDYVLGPINSVQGNAANRGQHYPAEDVVTGNFAFASGVQGVGVWSFCCGVELDQVEIVGESGKLTFSTFGTEPVALTNETGVTQFAIEHPPHIQQPLIQTIVDELNSVGQCPSTGISGARTNWVMDQFLQRYYNQG